MGLDNGIIVKKTELTKKLFKVKKNCLYEYIGDFEITYWRKCWNVRADIFTITEGWENDQSYTSLDRDDIYNIIKLLKSYNKTTWDSDNFMFFSMWTWEEHKKANKRHIRYLKYLYKLMKKYPELEVYFYDSY